MLVFLQMDPTNSVGFLFGKSTPREPPVFKIKTKRQNLQEEEIPVQAMAALKLSKKHRPWHHRPHDLPAAKLFQSCPILCDPIDGSPRGSPVPEILQARTLEWVAISFSTAWKWKVKVKLLSHVQLFATPWTAAYQAPLSMGFSRQEYWSGVPSPSPSIRNKRS